MAYSKAKLKSSGNKASPYFRPFWIGKLSYKCLPIRTLLYTACPGSVRTVFIKNTRCELFSKLHSFYSK
jgi:hypothetical protein